MRTRTPGETSFIFLLVEDDPAHAELVKRGFEELEEDFKVVHLSDGEAAVAYLFRQGAYADSTKSPRPHVVLLDLRLPRKSGFDVLQEVKADPGLCDIPVVVLTTSRARADAMRAYRLHANSFVIKPADFGALNALLRELSRYWLRWHYSAASQRNNFPEPNRRLRSFGAQEEVLAPVKKGGGVSSVKGTKR